MYKILFIDEHKEDIDNFIDYVEQKDIDSEFKVLSLYPVNNLNQMIEEALSLHVDAIISDFSLNEYKEYVKDNIPYNGTDLVKGIVNEREGFPCFVMTSFDDEAVVQSEDVNIVYIKGILHGSKEETNAKANFLDRVKNQIIHYRNKISCAEEQLITLLKKSESEPLSAFEQDEILRLDSLIEKALNKNNHIPESVKKKSESDQLSELIKSVGELKRKLE